MKILIISGSNHNKKYSSSYQISGILQKLFSEYKGVSVDVLCIGDYNIKMCKGCCQCFETGKCVIKDDMEILKRKMLEAEHLIYVSPVYAHHIPGLLKNYIDRSSNWLHTFSLLGKTSSSVVVSSSNGNVYVSDYLRKILEFYGTIYLGNMNITVDEPEMLNDMKNTKIIINKYMKQILQFDREHISRELIEKQSGLFQLFKKIYSNPNIKEGYEKMIWSTDPCLLKNSFWEAYECKRMMESNDVT